MSQSWRILHLTDLHFGPLEGSSPLFGDDDKTDLPPAQRDQVKEVFHSLLNVQPLANVDIVAVTGDFTERAGELGFKEYADTTAPRLKSLLRPETANGGLCVVPGNHDVAWRLSATAADFYDQKFKAFRDHVATSDTTSCLFPTGALSRDRNKLSWASTPPPYYCNDSLKLFVLCIKLRHSLRRY
jgi:3',5'-cyclic AMP phosphodiesterase CpdA